MEYKILSHSEEETQSFAENFAKNLLAGSVILLEGDLGAGKTTFVKALAKGLEVPESVMTHSPTFTLINQYPGRLNLVHIDLYRIDHPQQLIELGIEEYFDGQNILAVEWASKAGHFWPKNSIKISLKSLGSHSREIMVTQNDK